MKKGIVFFVLLITVSGVMAQDTTRLSLLFAGDVMGHDSQIASACDASRKVYDYTSCFQLMKPYIESADLSIANLEVTLAGPPYKGYPQFSSPDVLALNLQQSGFDALVTANNHSADRGKRGIERTIVMLDSFKIPHAGTYKDSISRANQHPLMLYKNGFSIALLNYTYGTNGLPVHKPNIVNMLDTALIRKDLLKAKALKPDVIIVFTHWGAEYQSLPSRAQKNITEHCFKHGAQLVIGAHPHVIQPMEWRKDKNQFVAYSLGNYVSGQRKRYTDGGALAYIEMEKVIFREDSTTTRIDSAGYYLQWVYRTADAKKDYYMLPVSDGDVKNKAFIKDQASEDAYALFVSDSRALYAKHNKHVNEIKSSPQPGSLSYKVLLDVTVVGEEPWDILTSQRLYLWGVDRDDRPDGSVFWLSGNFATAKEAEKYLERYKADHANARVVVYQDGVLVE